MIDNLETEENERTDKRPPKPKRVRVQESMAWIYRTDGNKNIKQGSFPVSMIGQPLATRLLPFIREIYHSGNFKVDIRNEKGHPEKTFHFEIAEEADANPRNDDIGDDGEDSEEILNFYEPEVLQPSADLQALQLQLAIERERRQRFEAELKQTRNGSQNETAQLINALEESRREQKELLMLMLQMQSQNNSQPKQDPTAQAMKMMESAFGMVTQARAISDELSPDVGSGGSSSMIGDAAKLVDSFGKNAATFIPIISSVLGRNRPTTQPTNRQTPKNTVESGELASLAAKIKGKGK